MTDTKTKPKKKRTTKATHKALNVEVAVNLSPEAEDLLTEINANLFAIAEEIGHVANVMTQSAVRDIQSMSTANDFMDIVKHVAGMPVKVDVPPTVGDVVDQPRCEVCTHFETCKAKGAKMEWCLNFMRVEDPFPPQYDPEDDTYATGKECPNCGEENPISKHTDGPEGMEDQWHCEACHHIWPYVLFEDRVERGSGDIGRP